MRPARFLRGLTLPLVVLAAALGAACVVPTAATETLEVATSASLRDGERFVYTITEPAQEPITAELRAGRTAEGWRLQQRYCVQSDAARFDVAESIVNEMLRPLETTRRFSPTGTLEEYHLGYRPADARVDWTHTTDGNMAKAQRSELRLRENAFDNESAFWLWRSLPLAEGYRARYTSVNVYEGSQSSVDLTVVGMTAVTVPAGTFEAWRVLVVSGRATRTAWIEVAAPHRLVQWDNGASVMQLEPDSTLPPACGPR